MASLLSTLVWLLILPSGAGLSYWAACLLLNYRKARKIGLPVKVIPFDHMNPLWVVLDRKIVPLVKRLPFGLGDNSFTRYNWRGFEREDKTRSHDEMGDAFTIATPGYLWVYVNDPDTVMDCLRRKSDFKHPTMMTEMLAIFGHNISVSEEDKDWKMHRRITASCFNDQNNQIVWNEGLTIANDMLKYWLSQSSVTTTADDTRTLSLHIMTRAGFGKSFKFVGHTERSNTSPSASYKESLQVILENCVLIMILGRKFLANTWLPRKLRDLNEACDTFQAHMTDMYEEEKRSLVANGKVSGGDRNLMTQLVRASQDQAHGNSLTEKEIYGNMFVFNFAGHDTTTHTLNFALFWLAVRPDVQDWLAEEVLAVTGDKPISEWDFGATFSRLPRCLAVLMETLRLYAPVGSAKWTDKATATLNVNSGQKTVVLPPKTMVISNYGDLHVNPKYYGPDPLIWRPDRWIKDGGVPGSEEFVPPRRGTFLAWSEGPRDCPGRKFAQVEVVAALAALFRDARVDPLRESGETLEEARDRVRRFIDDDATHVLLLQLGHPEKVPFVWSKR